MKLNLLNLIVLSLFTIGLSSQKALINHAAVKSDAQKLNPLVPLSDPELLGFDCNVLNHAIQNQLKMTARTPLKNFWILLIVFKLILSVRKHLIINILTDITPWACGSMIYQLSSIRMDLKLQNTRVNIFIIIWQVILSIFHLTGTPV